MTISQQVKNRIIAYYKKKLGVNSTAEVKNILTEDCWNVALNNIVDEVVKRKRRQEQDIANAYVPDDAEMIEYIDQMIDALSDNDKK